MKFFLRTGFEDSKEFASATGDIKTQGMCQGNDAAPAGWTVDSIAIIHAHKTKGHGMASTSAAQYLTRQFILQECSLLTKLPWNTST